MFELSSHVPEVKISAETLLTDPDSCKFVVGEPVHHGGPHLFESQEAAAGSPLPEALFGLPGVRYVLIDGDVVTVGKEPATSWIGLKGAIGSAIRTQLLTGAPAVLEVPRDGGHVRGDDELRGVVQALLDKEINPSIAAHGGQISLVDVKDRNLFISMSGGCQGCMASQVTLRKGFEVMVRGVAPEVGSIVDTTDHAEGASPFYR